jgi:hypothetical protein
VPIHYETDRAKRILIAGVKGVLEDADLLDYATRLLDDSELKQADHELVDLRELEPGSNVSTQALRQLADFWAEAYDRMSGGKLAIIADSDVAFRMTRMYQSYRDDGPDQIRIFRRADEAQAWLEEV